jgi:hypothetical protein
MAALHQTCVDVKIKNVLVSRSVSKENATEVVLVEFAASIASPFDADSGAKRFEKRKVRFDAVIPLKWCFVCF